MSNEIIEPIVERCYISCLCCSWLILEGELHRCYCGWVHTPEQSYPGGELPSDAEGEIHEFRQI